MKEIKELPLFTVTKLRAPVPIFLALLLGAWLFTSGCGIKKTVKVSVPAGIRQAKTAGFDELLGIIRGYDKITGLSCSDMKLTFTSLRKMEAGELEQFRSLDGYILLQRPDSTHLVLLMPITSSRFLDILSVGDSLSMWYPRKNEFYEGKNSAKVLAVEDPSGTKEFTVPLRGSHIFEAIFPQGVALNAPGIWVGVEQQSDKKASYYALSFSKEGTPPRNHTLRKIWIERAGLTIARQQVFTDEGQVVSDIVYSNQRDVEGFAMPQDIHIERPLDGYILDLNFRNWRINPDLEGGAFELKPPPEARIIPLREKGGSNAP
jgi:hypothetical protein